MRAGAAHALFASYERGTMKKG